MFSKKMASRASSLHVQTLAIKKSNSRSLLGGEPLCGRLVWNPLRVIIETDLT